MRNKLFKVSLATAVAVGLVCFGFFWFVVLAPAQTLAGQTKDKPKITVTVSVPPVPLPADDGTACWKLSYTKPTGDYKSLLKVKCEKEKKEAAKQQPSTSIEPGTIGVAAKNKAVTKVTYRDNTGKAIEASTAGADFVVELAKIDKDKEVSLKKAENPKPPSFWSQTLLGPPAVYYAPPVAVDPAYAGFGDQLAPNTIQGWRPAVISHR